MNEELDELGTAGCIACQSAAFESQGVYLIRVVTKPVAWPSDIVYVGTSGNVKQGVGQRLRNLVKSMTILDQEKSVGIHSSGYALKAYQCNGLEFSWKARGKDPDGVEKALLLAFHVSTGHLPPLNKGF